MSISFYNGYDSAKSVHLSYDGYSTENQRITRKQLSNTHENAHLHTQQIVPNKFTYRWQEVNNFKNVNKFSEHDNYNRIQNYGEYLDTNYGKRKLDNGLYYTKANYLSHESPLLIDNVQANKHESLTKYHFKGNQLALNGEQKWFHKYPKSHVTHSTEPKRIQTSSLSLPLSSSSSSSSSSATSLMNIPNYIKEQQNKRLIYGPWKFSFKKENTVYPNLKLNRTNKLMIDLSKY